MQIDLICVVGSRITIHFPVLLCGVFFISAVIICIDRASCRVSFLPSPTLSTPLINKNKQISLL